MLAQIYKVARRCCGAVSYVGVKNPPYWAWHSHVGFVKNCRQAKEGWD